MIACGGGQLLSVHNSGFAPPPPVNNDRFLMKLPSHILCNFTPHWKLFPHTVKESISTIKMNYYKDEINLPVYNYESCSWCRRLIALGTEY